MDRVFREHFEPESNTDVVFDQDVSEQQEGKKERSNKMRETKGCIYEYNQPLLLYYSVENKFAVTCRWKEEPSMEFHTSNANGLFQSQVSQKKKVN